MDGVIGLISANYAAKELTEWIAAHSASVLPYGGRYRLLDFALSNITNAGIRKVGIVTPYMYRSVMSHVRSGKEWALDKKYGGLYMLPGSIYGLKNADSKFTIRDVAQNKAFLEGSDEAYVIVAGGHIICNLDYEPILDEHIKSGADITMVYKKMESGSEGLHSMNIMDNGNVKAIRAAGSEENKFIDTFIIGRELLLMMLDWYANVDYFDFLDAVNDNLDKMVVRGYEFTGYVANITSLKSFFDCNQALLNLEIRNELFMSERKIITKTQDSVPTKYLPTAKVKNSMIPAGCIIKGTVENSILFRGAVIEEGAVVKNCIVMRDTVIESGAEIEYAIIGRDMVVNANTIMKGTANKPIIQE